MELDRCPSPATVASHLSSLVHRDLSNHVCNYNTCDIENLHITIHSIEGKYCITCKYLKSPDWVSENTMMRRVYNIYLCKGSGKIHHCHSQCDAARITNDDNCEVCVVSGVQYESVSIRSWQISSRCVPTMIQDKRDPNMYSRGDDGRVTCSGVHNIKLTQCVILSKAVIENLLFSRTRFQSERHKFMESRREAEKAVNKYRRYCDKNNRPKIYTDQSTIYAHVLQKRPSFIHLIIKDKEEKEKIITEYSTALIAYWKMFIHKTKATSPALSFKVFIPACLYTMRDGLTMKGVSIIEKSRYLESALPEANGLHMYQINKPSLTHGQKHIKRAILAAECSPSEMREYYLKQYDKLSI